MKKNSKLILALDVLTRKKAFNILDNTNDLIDAVKINYPLILNCGIGICDDIKKKYSLPIIGDFKIADIPITNMKIIDISIQHKIDFLMIHGCIGEVNVFETIIYGEKRINFFIVTAMTNCKKTYRDFKKHAELANVLKIYGVQAPATRPKIIEQIRNIIGNQMVIISCGVGAQGADFGTAIRAGADYEIVGRAIYLNKNPRQMTKKIIKIIQEVG